MTETVRIGLYICHCGHNIAGVISPEVLAEQARSLPGVAVCQDHLYSCSEAGQRDIAKDIQQFGLNRMVVAACSPKLHESTFRRLLAENGVNPYLLEIVNIREHCSWVHALEPEAALVKALELIRMGLAKVRDAVPLAERQVDLTRAALVIGGGPAGLRAALDIAHVGIPVTLVERLEPHQPHDGRGDASPRHHGAHRQRRHRSGRPPGQLPGSGPASLPAGHPSL
jgi:heterodisulfide reductase subunit A